VQRKLNKVGYIGQVAKYDGVRGYAFERAGAPLWVLWSLDGAEHTVKLDDSPGALLMCLERLWMSPRI